MRNGSVEQQTVDQVVVRIPGASSALRRYGIDPTNRMLLAQAAAAASVVPDALLAELEYRARRMAQRQPVAAIDAQENAPTNSQDLELAVGA
jgi:iron-sulfur cluster repair protein YtfE (RIC family)